MPNRGGLTLAQLRERNLLPSGSLVTKARHQTTPKRSSAAKPRVALGVDQRCEPCVRGQKTSISIVVGARNAEAWLSDALRSALAQDVKPREVVYSDDASSDGSVELARLIKGVKVLTSSEWQGVCAARNRGAAAATGEWLVFLDGDDVLPQHYLRTKVEAIDRDPAASIVYSPAQHFGAFNHLQPAPDWSVEALWHQNFINSSAMVRRSAFEAAGGWRESVGVVWDWDLWMRMARLGYRGIPDRESTLLYRRHSASETGVQVPNDDSESRLRFLFRNQHARTAICCVMSDRLIGFFPTWLERVTECVEHCMTTLRTEQAFGQFARFEPLPPNLVVLYTGDHEHRTFVSRILDRYSGLFGSVSLICEPWRNPASRDTEEGRSSLSRFLAHAYNRFLAQPEEVLWFLEDDVLPEADALTRLNRELLGGEHIRPAVAGWYRSRHNGNAILAHQWPAPPDPNGMRVMNRAPDRPIMVDVVGTGCLMVFRPLASHQFTSHVGKLAAHDYAWCLGLPQSGKGRIMLLHDVPCRHHITATEWV